MADTTSDEQLILEVSRYEVLYNKAHPEHKDAKKKEDVWTATDQRVGLSSKYWACCRAFRTRTATDPLSETLLLYRYCT